jgi:hypothetical protein
VIGSTSGASPYDEYFRSSVSDEEKRETSRARFCAGARRRARVVRGPVVVVLARVGRDRGATWRRAADAAADTIISGVRAERARRRVQ